MKLALRELEARASALLPVLLALFHARIAREEPGLLEPLAQLGVVDLQRAGDAVADRAGLPAGTAAVDGNHDVELVGGLGQRQRLLDDHLQHVVAEVLVERPLVDGDLAAALPDVDAGGGRLAPSRPVVFNQSQVIPPRYSETSSRSGFCAACGWFEPR